MGMKSKKATALLRRPSSPPPPSTRIALRFSAACIVASHTNTSSALRLRHSFRATRDARGVLAAAGPVVPIGEPFVVDDRGAATSDEEGSAVAAAKSFLATAGHDGGAVRLWPWPSPPLLRGGAGGNFGVDDDFDRNSIVGISGAHAGSVFALDSRDDLLLSGSFDRTATLRRIVRGDNGDGDSSDSRATTVTAKTVATLPEHTGWVRDVRIVPRDEDLFLLSLGCNLINVWTWGNGGTEARRLARLDAGPSPGDRIDEPFRRHDILCLDVCDEDRSTIVAGLVDGTLRAFDARWVFWRDRRRNQEGDYFYDATGSCARVENVEDDGPIAAVRAHEGRVTGVHSLPSSQENGGSVSVVSVGNDGCWRLWRLHDDGNVGGGKYPSSFHLVDEGEVGSGGDDDSCDANRRICSSVVVPASSDDDRGGGASLFVGTTRGRIYRISLPRDDDVDDESIAGGASRRERGECAEVWREEEKWGCGDGGERPSPSSSSSSITALSWLPFELDDEEDEEGGGRGEGGKMTNAVVAGSSDGSVRIFA